MLAALHSPGARDKCLYFGFASALYCAWCLSVVLLSPGLLQKSNTNCSQSQLPKVKISNKGLPTALLLHGLSVHIPSTGLQSQCHLLPGNLHSFQFPASHICDPAADSYEAGLNVPEAINKTMLKSVRGICYYSYVRNMRPRCWQLWRPLQYIPESFNISRLMFQA